MNGEEVAVGACDKLPTRSAVTFSQSISYIQHFRKFLGHLSEAAVFGASCHVDTNCTGRGLPHGNLFRSANEAIQLIAAG